MARLHFTADELHGLRARMRPAVAWDRAVAELLAAESPGNCREAIRERSDAGAVFLYPPRKTPMLTGVHV